MAKQPTEHRQTPSSCLEAAAKARNLQIIKPGFIEQIEALGIKVSREKLSNFDLSPKILGEVVTVGSFKVVVDKIQPSQE